MLTDKQKTLPESLKKKIMAAKKKKPGRVLKKLTLSSWYEDAYCQTNSSYEET